VESNTLSVFLSPVEWLSDQEGLQEGVFTATLLACELSLHKGRGLYECRLNRPRGDPVVLWSAGLEPMEEEEVTVLIGSTTPAPLASALGSKFSNTALVDGTGPLLGECFKL